MALWLWLSEEGSPYVTMPMQLILSRTGAFSHQCQRRRGDTRKEGLEVPPFVELQQSQADCWHAACMQHTASTSRLIGTPSAELCMHCLDTAGASDGNKLPMLCLNWPYTAPLTALYHAEAAAARCVHAALPHSACVCHSPPQRHMRQGAGATGTACDVPDAWFGSPGAQRPTRPRPLWPAWRRCRRWTCASARSPMRACRP